MGNFQVGLVDDLVAIGEDVNVERPRSPALEPFAALGALHSEAEVEEGAGSEARLDLGAGIEIGPLRNRPPGRRLVERRNGDDADAQDWAASPAMPARSRAARSPRLPPSAR